MAAVKPVYDQPGAAFVLLKDGIKFPPMEKEWQKHPHTFIDACAHKGNVGVMAGNGHIGLDQDDPTAFEGIELPITTTWETRPGRLGMRFTCTDRTPELLARYGKKPDLSQAYLYKDGRKVGEVKLERTYQVIPPSWKTIYYIDGAEVDKEDYDVGEPSKRTTTRADYKLLQEIPPVEISLEWLLSELVRVGITFTVKANKSKANLDKNVAKLERIATAAKKSRIEPDEDRARRYALAALRKETDILASAEPGDRNNQLNNSAFALGQFVGAGVLSRDEVVAALVLAAYDVKIPTEEMKKTIDSGLSAGERKPRKIPASKPSVKDGEEEYTEDTPVVEIIEGTYDIQTLLQTYKKWLYVKEDYSIVGPMVAAIANFCPGDPDIIGIIAPSGSTKTEGIRALGEKENQFIYPISSLSEHTFISGYVDKKGKPGRDLVPQLKHRLMVIKDLTTILAKREDVRSQIFADFRELTDGYIKKEFGNGSVKEYGDIHSSILFACTNAIERYYSMYSNLGQRMIFMRPDGDKIKARTQSVKNRSNLADMRAEIHKVTMQFLQHNVEKAKLELPATSDAVAEEMGPLFDFLAIARTSIHHDLKGNIDEIPEPEYPTRIANTLTRLLEVHALIYGRSEVGPEDVAFGVRIIKDNVPTMRLKLLMVMTTAPGVWLTSPLIAGQAELPTDTIKHCLDEMFALHLVDKISRAAKVEGDQDRNADSFMIRDDVLPAILRLKVEGGDPL